MCSDKTKNVPYVESVPYKLAETCRISELMARNYYKDFVIGEECLLDLDEFRILSHIISNPDLSQSDISKLVYKGKAHVGKILNSMAQKGYIKRVLSPNKNIMVKHTVLTEYGEKLYYKTNEMFRKLGSNVLDSFTDKEIESFLYLLGKFQNSILEKYKIYF